MEKILVVVGASYGTRIACSQPFDRCMGKTVPEFAFFFSEEILIHG